MHDRSAHCRILFPTLHWTADLPPRHPHTVCHYAVLILRTAQADSLVRKCHVSWDLLLPAEISLLSSPIWCIVTTSDRYTVFVRPPAAGVCSAARVCRARWWEAYCCGQASLPLSIRAYLEPSGPAIAHAVWRQQWVHHACLQASAPRCSPGAVESCSAETSRLRWLNDRPPDKDVYVWRTGSRQPRPFASIALSLSVSPPAAVHSNLVVAYGF